jgi:hypothetical protein
VNLSFLRSTSLKFQPLVLIYACAWSPEMLTDESKRTNLDVRMTSSQINEPTLMIGMVEGTNLDVRMTGVVK